MKLTAKDEFDFLNSDLWLEYTQKRYVAPDEIEHRLRQQKTLPDQWSDLSKKIISNRKIGSIPLFINSIDRKFWYFPSDSINRKIVEIENIGRGLFNQIGAQSLFSKEFLLDSVIEEAITSAIYEGAHTTRAQAQQLIASGNRPQTLDEWMLVNNLAAMKWVHEHRSDTFTEKTLLELHKVVTENTLVGDDANFSGRFRNNAAYIGPHEGTEHSKIRLAVDEMIQITTKNERYIHPLLQGILIHYFIGYIHPFFDGNGRTARALFYFNSMQNGLDYVKLLSVSAYLKTHGTQYEKAFVKAVQWEHDITYFIDFCLDSMCSALSAVQAKVKYLLKVADLREKLDLTANQIGLLQRMALHKFRHIDIENYARQISKSREVARQELKSLAQTGLIKEFSLGKKFVYKIDKARLEEALSG